MFISSLFNSGFKLKYKDVFHTIPFFVVFAVLELHWSNCFSGFEWINSYLYTLLNVLFGILVLGYSFAIIYQYFLYSKLKKIISSSVWVKAAVFGYSVSALIVQFANMHANDTLRFVIGDSTFLVYFSILFYVAIVNRTITDKNEVVEKYRNSNLKNHVSNEIMEQIEAYMQTTKAYINPELCLRNFSEALNIQEKYISETINKLKNQNFSEFINSYRISYAKDLLRNPENRDKTILYVLYEAGFNSKTTFNTCFKKVVGCTPLEYKKKYVLTDVTDEVSV
jgi:AraC-like DNA-binding protein